MSATETWLLFAGMGAVTLALRASFVLLQERLAFPPIVRRALTYVPPAVLAAIVAPALFSSGAASLGPVDARLPAALVALAVAWRTKSVLATLGAGMVVLWTLTVVATRLG